MEDDIQGNKDDLMGVSCVEDVYNEEGSSLTENIHSCAVIPDTAGSHPPPPTRSVDDMYTPSPEFRNQESSVNIDSVVSVTAVSKDIGTRADTLDSKMECNKLKDNITVVKKPASDITVNGVSLMKLMKLKSDTATKKTPVRKKVKAQEDKKTRIAPPSIGSIKKYLVKNNEAKLTFTNSTPGHKMNNVRNKIENFQELSKTVGGGALRAAGVVVHTAVC